MVTDIDINFESQEPSMCVSMGETELTITFVTKPYYNCYFIKYVHLYVLQESQSPSVPMDTLI